MTRQLLGQTVSDEVYAGWERLSNADKLSVVHADQASRAAHAAEAKIAALPPKPANWDRGSPMDRRTWFHQVEREREGR